MSGRHMKVDKVADMVPNMKVDKAADMVPVMKVDVDKTYINKEDISNQYVYCLFQGLRWWLSEQRDSRTRFLSAFSK